MTETNIKNAKQNQNKKFRPKCFEKFLNFGYFNKMLFFSIIILGAYYLVCINDLTVKGFRLQELRKEISSLTDENNEMKNKTMVLESYGDISRRLENLEMVAVGKVDYVTAMGGVAVRK